MNEPGSGAMGPGPEGPGMSAGPAIVPAMTLEERVTVLEHDVVVLRSETRGWAGLGVLGASTEAIPLPHVYREVIETKIALEGEIVRLNHAVAELKAIAAQHTETLNQHTVLLHEILDRLPPRPAA